MRSFHTPEESAARALDFHCDLEERGELFSPRSAPALLTAQTHRDWEGLQFQRARIATSFR